MLILQIIVSIFVFLNLGRTYGQFRSKKISLASFLWWLLLWLVILLVFWRPDSTGYLALALGITRGADLMIYISVLVIFYLLFKIFVRLNKIEDAITRLVRQRALNTKEIDDEK